MAVTKFPCPSCQAVLQLSQVPPNGARIRCPKCQNVFTARSSAPAGVGVGGSSGGMQAMGRGSGAGMRAPAMPPGRSSQRMQAPAVGGSAGRMQAPAVGGSGGRIAGRGAQRAAPQEEVYDDYGEEPAPRRKGKGKSKERNLGLVLGLIGGAAALILVVVMVLVFAMPSGNTNNETDIDSVRRRLEREGHTLPTDAPASTRGTGRGRPTRPAQPTQPANRDDDDKNDGGNGAGGDQASLTNSNRDNQTKPATPPATATTDDSANPFEGLNLGSLQAKAPLQFATLKYLPGNSDLLNGLDLAPLEGHPQLARFLRKVMGQMGQTGEASPLPKLMKELDGNPLVELTQGGKLAKLNITAGMDAAKASESTTTVLSLKNPVDADHLVRTLGGEAIPALDGLRCYTLPQQDILGVKFNFFLCFPDDDKNVIILCQSQQAELDPLIRRGGDLTPAMKNLLDQVAPSHYWMVMSMEPLKTILPMAAMMAGQAPPEVQALLKELPKAQGFLFQARLGDNKAKLGLGLVFNNEGQGLSFANSLGTVWKQAVQPQLAAMGGSAGVAMGELLKNAKTGTQKSAALLSSEVSVGAMKEDYPQMAAALANLGNLAGAMPGNTPAPDAPTPTTSPPPTTASGGGGKAKSNPNAAIGVAEGNRIPDASGADFDGKTFKLSQYKGKVIVLDFWGYWCGPCVSMIPHNRELVEKHKNKPFAFIGVNTDKTMEQVKRGQSQHKVTWRSFFDPQNKIVSQFKIRAFPTVMIIDGNGVIRKIIVGAGPQAAAQVEKLVEELIHELQ